MPSPESWAPWLAMAATGALHGLHPASGWPLLALWGLRGRALLGSLAALALGQTAAVAWWVGGALPPLPHLGVVGWLTVLAATLPLAAMVLRTGMLRGPALAAGGCGLALLQGTGMALVPMLAGWCAGGSGPGPTLLHPLAGLAIHGAAMLVAGGLAAYVATAGRLRWIAALAWWTKLATASGCRCSTSSARPR